MPESQRPRKPMNPTPVYDRPRKSAAIPTRAPGNNIGRNIGLGVAATIGATGIIRHQRSKTKEKEKTVTASKNLINPFEEVVVFGKAYPVALPVSHATTIRALVPTGGHVGHGNALKHVHNSSGGGGRATKLERYTGKGTKKAGSPVAKGIRTGLAMASNPVRPGALGGGIPKTGRTAGRIQRLSRMQSGAEKRIGFGTTADRRTADMTALRGKVNFGDAGSKGKRLA